MPILKFHFYSLIPKNFCFYFSIFSMRVPDPFLKGHGSLAHAYKWYSEILPPLVVEMVDRAGFGGFVHLLEKSTNDLVHVYALAERWWDSTNTFHLPFRGDDYDSI